MSGATVVMAGLLAGVLTGCAPASGSADMRRIDAQMEGSFFPASVDELAAGRAFHREALILRAQIMAGCMSRPALSRRARAYVRAAESVGVGVFLPSPPQLPADGLVDLAVVRRTGTLVPVARPMPRLPATDLTAAGLATLQTRIERCTLPFAKSYAHLMEHGQVLRGAWSAAESRLQGMAAVQPARRAFTICARRHGVPPRAAASLTAFQDWLFQTVDGGSLTPDQSGPPAPSTRVREQVDARWSAMFVTCAGPLIAALRPRQQGLQQAFRRHHQAQIIALENQAASFVTALQRQAKDP